VTADTLELPAVPEYRVEASYIGPTWRQGDDGKFVLPERTLGWEILRWIEKYVGGKGGGPFVPTKEQKRFLLWWYAIDERGRFVYRDGVLQRIKGWGKDPIVAVICLVEMLGPCRFDYFTDVPIPHLGLKAGDPVGMENEDAWVQVAAVSKDQTRNTMTLFPSMITERLMREHNMTKLDLGKEIIYAHRGARRIEAVTSSPRALEGGRPTFVVRNETHHWLDNNDGHAMAEVIERNATKSAGGQARALSITNAYDPSEGSVAQVQREGWEAEQAENAIDTGVLYDSVESPEMISMRPPEAKEWKSEPATPEERKWREACIKAWLGAVVRAVRGDAVWLDIESIVMAIVRRRDRTGKAVSNSLARRFWFNAIVAAEDSWADPGAIKAGMDPMMVHARTVERDGDPLRVGWLVDPDDPIVVFFDGSKSDDATALVGVRLSDGYTFVLGIWAKPAGEAGEGWLSPRHEVDARVDEVFNRFNVVAFWGDPSHTLDDDSTRYWDATIDKWHRKYSEKLQHWAVKTGIGTHSIMWDMASPTRTEQFAEAAELVRADLHHKDPEGNFAPRFTHDGHPALVAHLRNARENKIEISAGKKTLISIRKAGRESNKKIDLAACLIGAQMLRRVALNVGVEEEETEGGWISSI